MNNPSFADSDNNASQRNSLSIYNADGVEDFPVLKAFQQYIDAEQAKARKRMIWLCIFFSTLMTIVIAIGGMMLNNYSARNQALNDKLLEIALKNHEPDRSVAEAADVQMKAMTDTLVQLQRQLVEQQAKAAAETAKAATDAKIAAEKALKELAEKSTTKVAEVRNDDQLLSKEVQMLKKKAALLAEEKRELELEKERLKKEKIELHLRKMYPKHYNKNEAIEYFEEDNDVNVRQPPKKKVAPAKTLPPSPISYFDDDDSDYEVPVEIKGSKSNWSIPLD
jgi:hypothetical protein